MVSQKTAAILFLKETVAEHLDWFRPIARLTTMTKLVGYLWLLTL